MKVWVLLLGSDKPRLLLSAIHAVAQAAAAEAVPGLVHLTAHKNRTIAREAIIALGTIGPNAGGAAAVQGLARSEDKAIATRGLAERPSSAAQLSFNKGAPMRSTTQSPTSSGNDHEPQHLHALLQTLASDLRELASKAEAGIKLLETRPLDLRPEGCPRRAKTPPDLIDAETFSVHWRGKTCHLGYTVLFRLIDHLARHANRFVSHQQLLDDVWGGPRSASAVRSAVTGLRTRLNEAGMEDLAVAIDGHNSGHYGLLLNRTRSTGTSD